MGRKAKGTLLKIGNGAEPEVFASIAELTKISFPEFGTGTMETTSFDSTEEEFQSDGIQQHGELAIEGNWLPEHATQSETAGLLKAAIDGTLTNFQIAVAAGAGTKTYTFPAFVKFRPKDVGPKDALGFTGTLKVSGAVEIA